MTKLLLARTYQQSGCHIFLAFVVCKLPLWSVWDRLLRVARSNV